MSEMFDRVYKPTGLDYGIRLKNLILLPYEEAVGAIYRGLYYENSGYEVFKPRYVLIPGSSLRDEWVEDDTAS